MKKLIQTKYLLIISLILIVSFFIIRNELAFKRSFNDQLLVNYFFVDTSYECENKTDFILTFLYISIIKSDPSLKKNAIRLEITKLTQNPYATSLSYGIKILDRSKNIQDSKNIENLVNKFFNEISSDSCEYKVTKIFG